jgi:hypothetical protein
MPEMLGVDSNHFNDTLMLALALKVDTLNPSEGNQVSET